MGPGSDGALQPGAWDRYLLEDDPDREFIMQGVTHGFRITNTDTERAGAFFPNHRSALDPSCKEAVQRQIQVEIDNGRYRVVDFKPSIVSGLAAIPKSDGTVRLLHDASRPAGVALNDYAVNEPFNYQTVEQAAASINHGDILAKVDLSSAYRSVKIHPEDYHLSGLAWDFGDGKTTYLVDKRLMFGARLSAYIFNSLSQAVCRFMAREGHQVFAYLDDYLLREGTREECQRAFNRLICMLRELGFAINYNKVIPPTTCLTFLGIEIDTVCYVFRLPQEKLRLLRDQLRDIRGKHSISRKELRSLTGRLSWSSRVVYGGRTFTRRLIDRMNQLKSPAHRTRVKGEMRSDLQWWSDFLTTFNGVVPILEQRQYTPVTIDACLTGAGGVYAGDWFHVAWKDCPDVASLHINHLEVLTLEPAAALFCEAWRDRLVTVYSDNQAAVGIINKGSTRNALVMRALRHVFWLSASYNFRIKAVYYPGVQNTLADRASRLQETGGYEELQRVLTAACHTQDTGIDTVYAVPPPQWI